MCKMLRVKEHSKELKRRPLNNCVTFLFTMTDNFHELRGLLLIVCLLEVNVTVFAGFGYFSQLFQLICVELHPTL